jgi:dolichol-phosphate mannosyltransferase
MRPLRNDLRLRSAASRDADASEDVFRRDVGAEGEAHSVPVLSVVIPMHDEADNVVSLVAEICAALGEGDDYEIVLVDDGSRDSTLREMQRARAQFGPRVRVIRHDRNRGQSSGIWTGVRAARGGIVATLDGDGQNDPADIPRLLAELRARASDGVAMVAGQRQKRQDSWLRRVSSRIANSVRNALLHDGITDTGCGLKVFDREAFLALPPFDHMHRFLPALVRAAGGGVVALPVSHRPRARGGRSTAWGIACGSASPTSSA